MSNTISVLELQLLTQDIDDLDSATKITGKINLMTKKMTIKQMI